MQMALWGNWLSWRAGRGLIMSSVCCAALIVAAPKLHAETLNDALAQTYNYSPQLDAQRAALRATDEKVSQANAGYRPDIRASADVGRLHQEITSSFGRTTTTTTSPRGYGISLVQPIFKGFQVTNAVNSAEAEVRAGREQLRNVEQQVLLDAVTVYGNVVRDQATLKLQESNLNFLRTELKATKERFAVGEVTKTDVAQSEARVALAQADLDQAKANLKASRAEYERIVGSPPHNLSDANPNSKLLPRSLEDAIGIGTKENPDIVAALYSEQSARYQVDQVRGELLPTAQLEATFNDRFDSQQVERSESASIVGRLSVPIYANGGDVHSRVREAKQIHLERIQKIEQARALVQSQVSQAWSQLIGFKAQLESDKAQIAANRVALDGVREEEKVGQRTRIEVLDQQLALLRSQETLEVTKRNVLVATYTVIQHIGRLSVAEVGAVSTVYDPEVHYEEVRRQWWGIDITHDDGRVEHMDTSRGRVEPVK
jgi:outer membrane protein